MSALGPLEMILSVVFGCFILVLLAEIFFILYNRRTREVDPSIEGGLQREEEQHSTPIVAQSRELLSLLCWKRKPRDNELGRSVVEEHTAGGSGSGSCSCSSEDETMILTALGELQSSPLMHSGLVGKLFPLQGDLEDGDLWTLGGLLGPPRLLFTIKEESKDDLDSEDGRSRTGRSRKASRASSEFLAQIDLGAIVPLQTPFLTPPSSPPLTSPPHSPPPDSDSLPIKLAVCSAIIPKPLNILVDESSPILSSPPSQRRLSPLVEEMSLCSSSSSSSAASFQMSLLGPPSSSARWSGNPVEAFLEIPDSPSEFLHQNLEYPLRSPLLLRDGVEGIPIVGASHSNVFPESSPVASPSDQSEHASIFSTTTSHSWPPSPAAAPLRSAVLSPIFNSPPLCTLNLLSPPFERKNGDNSEIHNGGN